MAKYYHGAGRAGPYFEGWYLKQQNQRDTLAFIPAWHVDRKGRAQASLQVIANQDCWSLDYPAGPGGRNIRMRRCRPLRACSRSGWMGTSLTARGSG